MRYELVNSQPVVYSLGADRDDDGARSARTKAGWLKPDLAARWDTTSDDVLDGDWVLYPALE